MLATLLNRQGIDNWSFDVFALSTAANEQVLKYLGFDLMTRYGFIHKFKVRSIERKIEYLSHVASLYQIHQRRLDRFLAEMEAGYSKYKNPYHNR